MLCVNTYRLSHAMVLPRGSAVHVLLHQEAQPRDVCQAYLQARTRLCPHPLLMQRIVRSIR